MITDLLDHNRQWAEGRKREDPGYFDRLSKLQTPEYLWIGCSDSRVPANVITMNARFTFIEERTGAHKTCTLVFPREAQQDATLSIISPLGAAVIGASPGDTVEVVLDDNIETFRIVDLLYQPESAGDYHL